LPVSVERSLFMEYSTEKNILTEDEMKADLQNQKALYEENFLSECTILQAKTKYTKKETAMVLTVSYVIEGEIGTQKELLLKSDRKPYVASRKKDET
ncbi:MAG: sporulation protein YqfD, partial [Oscillospiraceae bacterium]|nr:sporulation protein YqfD [Oscillospiraceae bacterium]